MWSNVVFANSGPINIANGDANKLYVVDCSGGDITVNLPAVSGLTLLWSVAVKKADSSNNGVIIDCNGTDTIDGAATKTIRTRGTTITPVAYDTPSDGWESVPGTDGVPAGTIVAFGGTSTPVGFLACDGSAVNRTQFAALFSAIGTTWGAGNGSTTFNLPDFRRRTAVGSGGSGTGTLGNAVGNTGGAETHTLTSAENGPHTHASGSMVVTMSTQFGGSRGYVSGAAAADLVDFPVSGSSGSSGSGTAHNNMQPSAVVLYCIKT